MSYKANRWPKMVAGTIALGLLVAFFGPPLWHPLKERYFNYVSASCSETHGLGQIPWRNVPAFDGTVEQFVARSAREVAVRDCIKQWAGVIMTDRVSSEVSAPAIEFVVTGSQLAIEPPPRLVYYDYIRPAD